MVPNPRLSETQDEVPPLVDTPEENRLLNDPIESPSTEDNEADDSSKPSKSKSTVNEEIVQKDDVLNEEGSSDSTHYMIRDEGDKVEPEKKIPPTIEKNSKGESAAKVEDEKTTQDEEDGDGLDDKIEDDINDDSDDDDDDGDDDEEQDIKMMKMVEVPERRSRRACSAVVNYKIDDSDGEHEDESDKDNDPQEDGDYKDNGQDQDDDEEDEFIENESDVSEEASDFDPSQVDDEDVSEDDEKPEAQESSATKLDAGDKNGVKANVSVEEEKKDDDESALSHGKKRKKAPAKTKEEGPPKKKARVSEAVIQDAADKILAVLIQNYMDGIKEVPLDELAASITNKRGKPYTNHRSDAIVEGLKRLKAEGQAEKIKFKSTGAAKLTQSEIDKIPKEEISSDPQKVLEQRREQFLERLSRHKKGGKGARIVGAANAVWNKLLDGKAYTSKQLVAATDYTGTNSSGFEAIMVTLKKKDFVAAKEKGKYAFTNKVFPHGGP